MFAKHKILHANILLQLAYKHVAFCKEIKKSLRKWIQTYFCIHQQYFEKKHVQQKNHCKKHFACNFARIFTLQLSFTKF